MIFVIAMMQTYPIMLILLIMPSHGSDKIYP